MAVFREQQRFPTRNYPYGTELSGAAAPDALPAPPALANTLYRRVGGLDLAPRPMTAAELEGLDDPFGRLLRSGKPFPLSLRRLLAAIDGLAGFPDALPDQLVFLVADGGHIPWSPETDRLERAFRLAVARGQGEFPLLVSSSTRVDSEDDRAFLQVIGWDGTHQVFHYYERLQRTFFWAGMSPHALEAGTRGQGPFDSHVNGSLVMKELRAPWIHWHAPQAGINEEALAPDDPFRLEPLFRSRVTADRLETEVVRPGIRRWNNARVKRAVDAGGSWRSVRHFLRQAATDTTVNLASSDTASELLADDSELRPPLTFFLNGDTLLDALELELEDPTVTDVVIPGRHYLACLQRYDVHRTDGTIRVEGDSHFAFLTPEPAFEDTHLIEALLRARLVSPRFVACLSMTDFPNPVFSPRRAALLRYVPEEVTGADPAAALEAAFLDRLRAGVAGAVPEASAPDSPEREFLSNWETTAFPEAFAERIETYFRALKAGASEADVVDGWFRLAEYRRRRFRRRKLAEFALTTPVTNIPLAAPPLRMSAAGRVEVVS